MRSTKEDMTGRIKETSSNTPWNVQRGRAGGGGGGEGCAMLSVLCEGDRSYRAEMDLLFGRRGTELSKR